MIYFYQLKGFKMRTHLFTTNEKSYSENVLRKAFLKINPIVTKLSLIHGNDDINLSSNWIRANIGRPDTAIYDLFEELIFCSNTSYAVDSHCKQYRINMKRFEQMRNKFGIDYSVYSEQSINESLSEEQVQQLESGDFNYNLNQNDFRHHNALQNFKKIIRQKFLTQYGYKYDYDINCSMQAFFVNQFKINRQIELEQKKLTAKRAPKLLNDSLPTIENYIANKKQIRDELANQSGLTTDDIKEIITAICNGGHLKTTLEGVIRKIILSNSDSSYAAEKIGKKITFGDLNKRTHQWIFISELISKELVESIKSLLTNQFLISFRNDIKSFWSLYKKVNQIKARLTSVDKARVYFQFEFKIRSVIISFMQNKKIFLIHDGFVSQERIDIDSLINEIKKETNMNVTFSHEVLV